ncbi:MAG: hypothetical protein CMD99_07185 [Gammaproteobacteria bacterium]|nr:hypothetical protein [Gammaproteobacteria bacterium]|tara:strand:+ start:1116 stop:1805 length:690 start_codon:yes stop_codon:yes gene_type:complete
MRNKLYIYGCSGIGKSIFDSVKRGETKYTEVIFVDDDKSVVGSEFYNCDVISPDRLVNVRDPKDEIIFAFFKPYDIFGRLNKIETFLKEVGLKSASVLDPQAAVSSTARVGQGVYIAPGVVVDSDAVVGDFSIILFNSVCSREVNLAKSTFVSAGCVFKGSVNVSKSSFFSANCSVTRDIHHHVFINAGTVVSKSPKSDSIVSARSEVAVVPLPESVQKAERRLKFLHP